MRTWNRAQHYVEAIRLAEEVRRYAPASEEEARALDRRMALAQFHMTAATIPDTVWSGISGNRRSQGEEAVYGWPIYGGMR
jgi:hypothetical protein